MLTKGAKTEDLPACVWRGAGIPARVLDAIQKEGLLELGGVYGNKHYGDPIQCDHLKLHLSDRMVEIIFYNRAIALFMADDEKLRRIHRVMHILGEESER